MTSWVIQDQGFNGGVKLSSQRTHKYYEYSLWHGRTGEHLFDGAAGDLAEAIDSLVAHIHFLSAQQERSFAAASAK